MVIKNEIEYKGWHMPPFYYSDFLYVYYYSEESSMDFSIENSQKNFGANMSFYSIRRKFYETESQHR